MASDPVRTSLLSGNCTFCPVESCIRRRCGAKATEGALLRFGAPVAVMPGNTPMFEAGKPMRGLYAVRAGCIKTYTVDGQGNEHVRGFYLPGDLVGLDGLVVSRYRAAAAATTPSQVCAMPISDLPGLLLHEPEIPQQLSSLTSQELALALALCGEFTTEQRIAAFLLNIEERFNSKDGVLRLPMHHRDIGNYLRMAGETVCRTFQTFERKGWIRREEKIIRLLARKKLYEVGEPVGICRNPVGAGRLAAYQPDLIFRASATVPLRCGDKWVRV